MSDGNTFGWKHVRNLLNNAKTDICNVMVLTVFDSSVQTSDHVQGYVDQ